MGQQEKTRIEQLERRLTREKAARLASEKLLDEYSGKFFAANEKLKQSLLVAQRKQEEIEYLARTGFSISDKQDPDALIASTLGLTADFCKAEMAACFFTRQGNLLDRCITSASVTLTPENKTQLQHFVPDECTDLLDCWLIENISAQMARSCWAVCANFTYSDDTLGWLVLTIPANYIDEGLLYILDAYLKYLRTGIDKNRTTQAVDRTANNMQKIQTELSATKQQLVVADRMAALGFLASGVAHEINNPAAFIISNNSSLRKMMKPLFELIENYAQASRRGDEEGIVIYQHELAAMKEDILLMLEDNEYGLNRIVAISESLRTYSHFGEQLTDQVDINDCVTKMTKVARASLPESVELHCFVAEGLPAIAGNASQLEQVILNLLVNAIDALNGKGKVEIRTEQNETDVILTVKDTGQGMDDVVKTKLFTPFFTTKDVGKGTGLGLSISQNIIDAHHGRIEVESEVGVGTCFSIHFPCSGN